MLRVCGGFFFFFWKEGGGGGMLESLGWCLFESDDVRTVIFAFLACFSFLFVCMPL